MAICNEPEITKEIWTLLTEGIAGHLGKSKTMSIMMMIIRFIRPVFKSFSTDQQENRPSIDDEKKKG
jgi:hypothetical protein